LCLAQINPFVPGSNQPICAWLKSTHLCLAQINPFVPGSNQTVSALDHHLHFPATFFLKYLRSISNKPLNQSERLSQFNFSLSKDAGHSK
jgi:hypothetical protein